MEKDGDSSPFWFQPPVRSHRRMNSPMVNPVILIIVLPILAILLVFFLVPPFLSNISSVFRPSSVKKSWDSLNIVLVVFAILCGVLARRNDDGVNSPVAETDGVAFEESDRKFFESPVGIRRLRSSSSYPDLRQESGWETGSSRYRFYDDFDVDLNVHRFVDVPDSSHHRILRRSRSEMDQVEDVKVIPVDKFVNQSPPLEQTPSPSPSPAPPPPPPPPAANKSRRRHTSRSVPKREKVKKRIVEETERVEVLQPAPPPAPPPPPPAPPTPPPPMAEIPRSRHNHEKLERKKSSASKDIANTIASLYKDFNQSKRKRKSKSRHIYDNATQSPPSDSIPPPASPAPPPPPPPPPPSVFQTMFRKGSKSKRIHSFSASVPPPPPPPPPPASIFNNLFKNNTKSKRFTANSPPSPPPLPPSSVLNTLFKTGNKSKRFIKNSEPESPPSTAAAPSITSTRQFSSGKPPLPTRASTSSSSYYERDEYLNSGSQSPLIPPPPPPPPFRMPAMKYIFRGDFATISSNLSSRSTSPERDEVMMNSGSSSSPGLSVGLGFCPSPDVNVKAATFIARLRDEWKLEKMNSVKEKQKMGPSTGPN